jgi:hypothetical protein
VTLEFRLYEGNRAKEILESEVFTGAFDAIETEVIEQWTNSPARDQAARELMWTYIMLLRKVKANLMTTMESGKLAELDLAHRRSLSERARDFMA